MTHFHCWINISKINLFFLVLFPCFRQLDAGSDHTQSMSILQGVRGCKVSQQSKHPLFSLQRVLEPIMCGNSLWMCPSVQDSVPSGPHLKEKCDLQAEDWTPRHWAFHICITQHNDETDKMIKHTVWTNFVSVMCICVDLYLSHGDKILSHFWDSKNCFLVSVFEKKTS